jgi:hypothetical protein
VTTRSLCGFEAGDSLEVRSLNGTGSIQTSIVRTGTYAGRTNPTTTATGNFRIGQTGLSTGDGRTINELGGSNAYIRVYGYIATAPGSGDEEFFTLWDNAATAAMKIAVRLNSSRQLVIYDSANALQATGATALSLTTWYRFELRASTGAGSTAYELKIDGNVELASGKTPTDRGSPSITTGMILSLMIPPTPVLGRLRCYCQRLTELPHSGLAEREQVTTHRSTSFLIIQELTSKNQPQHHKRTTARWQRAPLQAFQARLMQLGSTRHRWSRGALRARFGPFAEAVPAAPFSPRALTAQRQLQALTFYGT